MATSQCFENPPSLSSTCGSGNLREIGGLKTYVTGPHDSKLAILLISDVFGYEAPNLRQSGSRGISSSGSSISYGEPLDSNNPNTGRFVDKGSWHGVVVVKLARTDDIQAAVLLHPGPITEDEIKEVKCPISILGAEIDRSSPIQKSKQFGEILSAKPGIDSFVKIFPGVSHGWSVRYDLGDESAVKSAEECHGDMLSWFIKYVK
ncbi:hypothetical protein LOK49_LG08G03037 [Camellia lanceoleosa]|uniref:Uncharacterized protein n=1 Tax=Camellia lanceoleosa TaxID=1840588 RepID=A0ACC0GT49_9ERIC|nr:hypothetical protein LOK49_LG08G03037 [Camellia lanceoleosa]